MTHATVASRTTPKPSHGSHGAREVADAGAMAGALSGLVEAAGDSDRGFFGFDFFGERLEATGTTISCDIRCDFFLEGDNRGICGEWRALKRLAPDKSAEFCACHILADTPATKQLQQILKAHSPPLPFRRRVTSVAAKRGERGATNAVTTHSQARQGLVRVVVHNPGAHCHAFGFNQKGIERRVTPSATGTAFWKFAVQEHFNLNPAVGRPENASFYHEDREGHEEMTF